MRVCISKVGLKMRQKNQCKVNQLKDRCVHNSQTDIMEQLTNQLSWSLFNQS